MAYICHVSCWIATYLTAFVPLSLVINVYEPVQTVLRYNFENLYKSDPKLPWKITKNTENRRFYR